MSQGQSKVTKFEVPNKLVISKMPNIGYYITAAQHSKLVLQFVASRRLQSHTPDFLWVLYTKWSMVL